MNSSYRGCIWSLPIFKEFKDLWIFLKISKEMGVWKLIWNFEHNMDRRPKKMDINRRVMGKQYEGWRVHIGESHVDLNRC